MPVGGWAPGVSRGFTFWRSALSLNNASMAATIEQPSQETPQKEEANQAPITLKNISEERIGREAWGENQLKEKSYGRIMLGKGNSTCH